MSKKTLEAHRELQFRVSLVRSGLQVDTVPNDTNVEQFAYHLLALLNMSSSRSLKSALGEIQLHPSRMPRKPNRMKSKSRRLRSFESWRRMQGPPQREAKKERQEESASSTFLIKDAEGERLVNGLMTKKMKREDVGIAGVQNTCLLCAQDRRKRRVLTAEAKGSEG